MGRRYSEGTMQLIKMLREQNPQAAQDVMRDFNISPSEITGRVQAAQAPALRAQPEMLRSEVGRMADTMRMTEPEPRLTGQTERPRGEFRRFLDDARQQQAQMEKQRMGSLMGASMRDKQSAMAGPGSPVEVPGDRPELFEQPPGGAMGYEDKPFDPVSAFQYQGERVEFDSALRNGDPSVSPVGMRYPVYGFNYRPVDDFVGGYVDPRFPGVSQIRDMITIPTEPNEPIYAPAGGVVMVTSSHMFGDLVAIDHGDVISIFRGRLDLGKGIKKDAVIEPGQPIAKVRDGEGEVDYGLKDSQNPHIVLDPMAYFAGMRREVMNTQHTHDTEIYQDGPREYAPPNFDAWREGQLA